MLFRGQPPDSWALCASSWGHKILVFRRVSFGSPSRRHWKKHKTCEFSMIGRTRVYFTPQGVSLLQIDSRRPRISLLWGSKRGVTKCTISACSSVDIIWYLYVCCGMTGGVPHPFHANRSISFHQSITVNPSFDGWVSERAKAKRLHCYLHWLFSPITKRHSYAKPPVYICTLIYMY